MKSRQYDITNVNSLVLLCDVTAILKKICFISLLFSRWHWSGKRLTKMGRCFYGGGGVKQIPWKTSGGLSEVTSSRLILSLSFHLKNNIMNYILILDSINHLHNHVMLLNQKVTYIQHTSQIKNQNNDHCGTNCYSTTNSKTQPTRAFNFVPWIIFILLFTKIGDKTINVTDGVLSKFIEYQ